MSVNQSKILLIPLDERPVNTRYPQMIAQIGGAKLILPPEEIRGFLRQPADLAALSKWLCDSIASENVAAALISCDFLGYGNLINSRISSDSAVTVINRLSQLELIGKQLPVHAFSIITRVSNANDNVEEPLYWIEWGEKFYAYSRLSHRVEIGETLDPSDQAILSSLNSELPESEKSDWLTRRLRNHAVNLALADMAARGNIESLLLTSDDTAPYGFPSRERDWLAKWRGMLGDVAQSRVQMHPGADEVGSALVANVMNQQRGISPKIWVEYSIPTDSGVVALYEDRPISGTVVGQIEACRCSLAESLHTADIVLGVVTPSPRRIDYRQEIAQLDKASREPFYLSFIGRLAKYQANSIPVALADVAFPNGSDPQFSKLIFADQSSLSLGKLAAYGAWNTAGNTLGTVIAQASALFAAEGDIERLHAQSLFLTHRFLEDHGYQQIVRREARAFAKSQWGRLEPDPKSETEQTMICRFIEDRLNQILLFLQERGIGTGLRITPDSVKLPWKRTFEVDFEIQSD